MLYIIAFLFTSATGDQYLNQIEQPFFKTEKACNAYVKKYYPQRKDLKFYCVREDLYLKKDYK